MRWSEEQDDVILELGHLGAAAVAEEIWRRFGVRRNPHAVEMRASRIHASLAVRSVCPRCGAVGVRLNRATGLCPLCAEREFLSRARAQGERLEAERAAAEDPARLAEVRREWDAQRARNSRARKAIRRKVEGAGGDGGDGAGGGASRRGGDADGGGSRGASRRG